MIASTPIPRDELLLSNPGNAIADCVGFIQAEPLGQFFKNLRLGRREANVYPFQGHVQIVSAKSCA